MHKLNAVWFMLNTCFPSESLEFWNMPGRECAGNLPPIKTVGAEFLMSRFSRQSKARMLLLLLGKVCLVWSVMRGSGHKKAYSRVFSDSACSLLLWSSVCPYYIAVVDVSPKYNSIPGPLSTSDAEQGPMGLLGMGVFLSPISYK